VDAIECDMRAVAVYIDNVEDVSSGGLGHRWSTPNSWDRGEGEEDINIY